MKFAAVESYIIRLLEVIFLFTTAYAAIKLIPSLTHTSAALQIPRKWYYMPVIVFSIYMGLAIVVDLLNELCPGYDSQCARSCATRRKRAFRMKRIR